MTPVRGPVIQLRIYSLFEVGAPPGQAGSRGNLQGVRASWLPLQAVPGEIRSSLFCGNHFKMDASCTFW